jgi:GTPase SAR1 family protein
VYKLLVGNKSDLLQQRTVSYEQGQAFARDKGIEFVEVSARHGTNVEEAFIVLAKQIQSRQLAGQGVENNNNRDTIQLTEEPPVAKKKRSACCF